MPKLEEKEKAIKLRKRGLSYNEILKEVPVAKSTLSLWLRSVGLAKKQRQRLTEKRLAAAIRGAMAKRNYRLINTEKIKHIAKDEIKKLSRRELWLIGITLYWAEGQKEKEWNVGVGVKFSNSDAKMVNIFLMWLREICNVNIRDIKFEIYIHKNSLNHIFEIKRHWSRVLNLPLKLFQTIYFKKHNLKTRRHNIGRAYYGLLTVRVRRSSVLNRKITGWIEGIYQNCRVV